MLACSIIAMNSEDVQEEEEPVVCLLDRLKCQIESDLAQCKVYSFNDRQTSSLQRLAIIIIIIII